MGIDWGNDIVNIDLECTASEKSLGSICELGAVIMNKNSLEITSKFESLVYPYKEYFEEGAMKVHGIPKEELYQAPDLRIVLGNFELWIKKNISGGEKQFILSSYGAYFDIPYLEEAYKCINQAYPLNRRSMDLKAIVRDYFAITGKPFSGGLGNASKKLGIPFEGQAHRALDDAIQGALIFKEIEMRKLKMLESYLKNEK